MGTYINLSLIIVLSYLLGSFPSAFVISKKFFGFDIRKKGSGNMGSTNAFRVLGWKWGIVVQLIDLLKGFVSVILIAYIFGRGMTFHNAYFEDFTIVKLIAGLSAVCGHIWTIFAGFKGGKGINTTAGMLIAVAPIDVGIAIGIFALAVLLSGYISLGSMLAAVTLPSSIFIRYNIFGINVPGYHILIYASCVLAGLIIFTHRENIKRLIKGNENRFAKFSLIKYKSSSNKKR